MSDSSARQALSAGHQGAGHAGCFVRRGHEMLAVKLTYDGAGYFSDLFWEDVG